MSEFATARFPDAELPKIQPYSGMLRRVRKFIPNKGRARLREVGGDFGNWTDQADVMKSIERRTLKLGVGPKLIVQRESDRESLSVREVTNLPDLGANPTIEEIHAEVWANFDVRSGGLWLCRFIDGTRTVSHHGFQSSGWKGAAEDIFVTSGGMPALVEVAEFVVDRAKRKVWGGEVIETIVDNSIWTPPDYRERVYGGNRHYHNHNGVAGGSACRP